MGVHFRIKHNLDRLMAAEEVARGVKLTHQAVAKAAGIHSSTMSRFTTYKTSKTDWAFLDALANYFGVDPSRFLEPIDVDYAANRRELDELLRVAEPLTPMFVRSVTDVAKSLQAAQAQAPHPASQTKPH